MEGFIGELFGTMMLVILGDGVVGNVVLSRSKAQNSGWMVICSGWAFAVMVGVFLALALGSPAHINPAVTIAMAVAGKFPWTQVPMFIIAQTIGAFIAAIIVWLHFLPHWSETEDPGLKLCVFSTAPAIRSTGSNLTSEIIGTVVLVIGVAAIFKGDVSAALGPFLVASLVWGIGLSLGGTTGYAINPARDLGPRIAHAILPIPGKGGSDFAYGWIPVVGPSIGALVAGFIIIGLGL